MYCDYHYEGTQNDIEAPDFNVKTLDDKEVNLSDFKGKEVMLSFFDTSCSACKVEELNEFNKKNDDVEVMFISYIENEEDLFDYIIHQNLKLSERTYYRLKDRGLMKLRSFLFDVI